MFTELDGVNRLLALTGEAPVTSLATPQSSSVAAARVTLDFERRRLSSEANLWNEDTITVTPDAADSYAVRFGADVLDVLPTAPYEDHRFVLRGNQLWDQTLNTGSFDPSAGWPTSWRMRAVRALPFDQMPSAVQAFVIAKAVVAQASGTGDSTLMSVAATEFAQAQVDYVRFLNPPGRASMLDAQSASYFWRLKRR